MERGVDHVAPGDPPDPCGPVPGGVIAQDLDADGDIDLAFHRRFGFPALYRNNGGAFTLVGPDFDVLDTYGRSVLSEAAVDRNGDGLPEILVSGQGLLLQSTNLGGMQFGPWEELYRDDDYPRTCFNSMNWGDVDNDGDLDVILPGLLSIPYEGWFGTGESSLLGSQSVLLRAEGDAMVVTETAINDRPTALTFLGAFTDRDLDGDMDLLLTSDRPFLFGDVPAAFYRNDGVGPLGLPMLTEDAAERGIALPIQGMGMGTADFNDDGQIDYCITDVGPKLRCLVSSPSGGRIESGAAMGLEATLDSVDPEEFDARHWVPWSVALTDLDNDGFRDVAVAAGPPPDAGGVGDSHLNPDQPDALFAGVAPDRFEDRSTETGFNSMDKHFGLASADLDGDGYREIIIGTYDGPAAVWTNPCGTGAWLEVELVGPSGNREGFGARLEARDGEWWDVQELQNQLGVGQGPSRFHLGLGLVDQLDLLRVTWPDGAVMEAFDVPTRGVLTVTHPDA